MITSINFMKYVIFSLFLLLSLNNPKKYYRP